MVKISITQKMRDTIIERDHGSCVICGFFAIVQDQHCIDIAHVRPEADHGKNEIDNLLSMCPNCHKIFDNLKAFYIEPMTGDLMYCKEIKTIKKNKFTTEQAKHIIQNISKGNLEYRKKYNTDTQI